MTPVTLRLQEKYSNMRLLIDISTFSYYGLTKEYSDGREDSSISFTLADHEETKKIVELLKEALVLNVDKDKYVRVRYDWDDYITDKRPKITLRLPSGYRGMVNPFQFRFSND